MKYKKLLGTIFVVGGLVGVLSFDQGAADEKKVFIPDDYMRQSINSSIENKTGEIVENETPTISQMESLTSEMNIDGGSYDEPNTGVRSIEGINYAKNVKTLRLSDMENLREYRPIGEMAGLERIYIFHGSSYDEFRKEKEIDFVANLTNLQVFDGDYPALDLTPFNNLDNLKELFIATYVDSSTKLPVSQTEGRAVMANPVTYSKQFKENFNQRVEIDYGEITVSEGYFHISNIPEDVEQLNIGIRSSAENGNQSAIYDVQYMVDVAWY